MSNSNLYELLKRPLVTEKTTALQEYNQYAFEVCPHANKIELAKAFELAFPGRKVSAVRMIKVPSYQKKMGKHKGATQERRKAIFKIIGEPIELIPGA